MGLNNLSQNKLIIEFVTDGYDVNLYYGFLLSYGLNIKKN